MRHGHARRIKHSRTYNSWHTMKRRCLTKTDDSYRYYGGRGITVCKRWLKFENFLEDMGVRPLHKTLDRVNNNRNYTFYNCRWATRKQQNNNNRKQARWKVCKKGHLLIHKNLYYFSDSTWRCKTCTRSRYKERRTVQK